jgi:titin
VQSGLSDTTDNFLIVNTPSINTQPATAYDFVVWTVGAGNEEFRSNLAWVKTLAQAVTVAAGTRTAPSNLTASATSPTTVQLNWARNASDNDDVEVWRDGALLTTLGGAVSTFTDTVLAASTHAYKVRNKWNTGTAFSLYSADASATTDAVPSGAANPTGLYAESNYDNTADVFWNNNGNLGAVTLKYRENGTNVWQSVGIAAGQNTATLYGLNENTTYQLQVEIAGASEPSNIAFVYIRMIIIRGPYGGEYPY